MSFLFHTFAYNPIYNLLVFLIDFIPQHDVGVAIILVTLVVRLILTPLSKKAFITQLRNKEAMPEIDRVRKQYANNREEQARKMIEVYKKYEINPLSSVFLLFIQIPVIFALFFIFSRSGLPTINTDILYSFIPSPETVNMLFLGIQNMAAKSWPLALLAGAMQYLQGTVLKSEKMEEKATGAPSFQRDLQRSMEIQIRYVLPVVIVFVAHTLTSAVALYFAVSSAFSFIQEKALRRTLKPVPK